MLDLTKDTRAKVLIGSPSSGSAKDAYTQSLFQMIAATDPDQVLLLAGSKGRATCRGSNIAENQCTLIDAARSVDADYLFLIETDVAFPPDTLTRLLAHDKDIVGASTQYKEHDLLAANIAGSPRLPRYMGYELDGTEFTIDFFTDALDRNEKLVRVAGIPMGLTLLRMSGVDAVSRAVADLDATVRQTFADRARLDGNEAEAEREEKEAARIRAMWGPAFHHKNTYLNGNTRGIVSTSDMAFCGIARAIGLDIWVDTQLSLQTEHVGEMNFGLIPPVGKETKAA